MNLIDDRSTITIGTPTLMPIWFVPGLIEQHDASGVCTDSVPRMDTLTGEQESCAHVCTVEEVRLASQGDLFQSEACGWTDDIYTCVTAEAEAEKMKMMTSNTKPHTLYEPVTGVFSVTTTKTTNGLGVCAWQQQSGVYCCANTVRSDTVDGDVVAECPSIKIDQPFGAFRGDNDTKTGVGSEWQTIVEPSSSELLKRAIAKAKDMATEGAVEAAKEEAESVDVKKGPTPEAVEEIDNMIGAISSVATGATGGTSVATGGSTETGGSAETGGSTATGGSAATGASAETGSATGGALLKTRTHLRRRHR